MKTAVPIIQYTYIIQLKKHLSFSAIYYEILNFLLDFLPILKIRHLTKNINRGNLKLLQKTI